MWTALAAALAVLIHVEGLATRRFGPDPRPAVSVLYFLASPLCLVAVAIWLAFDLGWYAFLLLGILLLPLIPPRTDPEVIHAFRTPIALLIVVGTGVLWAFGKPG